MEAPQAAPHAWSVGPSALKGSARDVYEKMLNPQLGTCSCWMASWHLLFSGVDETGHYCII